MVKSSNNNQNVTWSFGVTGVAKTINGLNEVSKASKKALAGTKKSLKKSAEVYERTEKVMRTVGNMTTTQVKKIDKAGKQVGKTMHSTTKRIGGFRMEFLGLMFGMMAIFRVSKQIISSIVAEYKKLTEGAVTPLNAAFTRLEANTKFLKFQLLDALSPILIPFIEFVSALALSLARMEPSKLQAIGLFLITVAGISGLGMVVGQMVLLGGSLAHIFGSMSGTSAFSSLVSALKDSRLGLYVSKLNFMYTLLDKIMLLGPISILIVALLPDAMRKKVYEFLDKIGGIGTLVTIFIEFVSIGLDQIPKWGYFVEEWTKALNKWVNGFLPSWLIRVKDVISALNPMKVMTDPFAAFDNAMGAMDQDFSIVDAMKNFRDGLMGVEDATKNLDKIETPELAKDETVTAYQDAALALNKSAEEYQNINDTIDGGKEILDEYIIQKKEELEVAKELNEEYKGINESLENISVLSVNNLNSSSRGV